ncbi:PREDICTED: sodium/potassium-transporting ATPase subunit beta-2-like [Acromyrmex echinatior]|uniref:sodium/potassium-transporting ATPase subunit beta-2-like n=1 Tax=Acromyrmex echinatior TaxID=103372 RepID=UPI000580F90A|nr:PREDICTED: sodium/potassium-transporting ATPase subunit beta-2-like [Acromyrmex echinatior]
MSVRGKQVQNGTYEFDYMRAPDTRTRWQIIRHSFHNPIEGTYCGHTPKKWGITLIFYTFFYAALAILFSISMKGLLATLSDEKPKWTLSSSIIGTNPGLGFRPISDNPDERSLVWYSASNATDIQKWTKRLDKFLENYINPSLLSNGGRNQQICSYNKPAKPGNVCAVDVNNWGPCSPNQQYGFNNSAPCIFIKLNRIYGWIPEFYNNTQNLPPDMPETLVKYIKLIDASWVSYVHFVRPTRNQIINVECRAWAKNIEYSSIRSEKKGAVHFELMVDE